MTILIVRHAKAGDRERWTAPDDERPLSKPGWRQAEALATKLPALLAEGRRVARIVTSPYLRCRQTVEPLAAALGIEIEDDRRLEEGRSLQSTLTLLASLPDEPIVLCSHGDVIGDLAQWLLRQGLIAAAHDPIPIPIPIPESLAAKGSTWVIEREGDEIVSSHYVGPPTLQP